VGAFVEAMAKQQNKSKQVIEKEFFEHVRPSSLLKRFATVDEVAAMVTYVASELSSATNGAALRVDGGVVRAILWPRKPGPGFKTVDMVSVEWSRDSFSAWLASISTRRSRLEFSMDRRNFLKSATVAAAASVAPRAHKAHQSSVATPS
jgi:hypothetical protein